MLKLGLLVNNNNNDNDDDDNNNNNFFFNATDAIPKSYEFPHTIKIRHQM